MVKLLVALALIALTSVAYAITTQLPIHRVATNVHVSPLKAKLQRWHAHASQAFNSNPAYMDMMLGLFVANVTVGTPPQPFLMGLDTGSADFWIIDSSCATQTCLGEPKSGHTKRRFDKSKSSTFINNGTYVEIQYVTGVTSGTLGQDTLTFGGISDANQPLGVMNLLDEDLGYMPADGIFGVAWPSVSSFGVTPPLNRVVSQLTQPLFSVWLDKHPRVATTYNGVITYGAVDNTNCVDDWNYVPLRGDSFWVYRMDSFALGGKVLARGEDVTADTGTSWINVPNHVVDKITRATGAEYDFTNDMYTVDCSVTGLPDFVFTFGGKDYPPLTQADYLLAVGGGKCAVKIYAQDLIGGWLVGDTFMRPYCHVYDIGKRRIGLAKSKH